MLNNSGESGHPCLVPDLRENAFSFSSLRIKYLEINLPKETNGEGNGTTETTAIYVIPMQLIYVKEAL